MLIEFSVKNFMSFKNKVTLSMEKGNGDENLDNIFKWKDAELVKVASIYGANASGKSNLLKAFYCAILMVRNSSMISINGKWLFIKPFMFDDVSSKGPSEFEFIILASGVKYKYYFVLMDIRFMMKDWMLIIVKNQQVFLRDMMLINIYLMLIRLSLSL